MGDKSIDSALVSTEQLISHGAGKDAEHSDHNLLGIFGKSLQNSITMPLAGTKQLLGDDSGAREYFSASDTSSMSTTEKFVSQGGGLFGNAALFIGSTLIAKKIPFVGKFAPVAVGSALGYLEPLQEGENAHLRIAHAGLGAATVSILEYGPKRMGSLGFKSAFSDEVAKVTLAGAGAGMMNTEAQSVLHTGKLTGLDDAIKGGLAWGLTGGAFHIAGAGLGKLSPFGIGSPKNGEVYVIGSRFSEECFTTRDFLQKNHIPFKVYDPESNFFARRLMKSAVGEGNPGHNMIILPDGKKILCGQPMQLAEQLGMQTKPASTGYDTVIVGAGPAGLQASIYGTSEGLNTLMIDGRGPGGQAGTTSRIENVMGFQNGVSGPEFTGKAFAQTKRLGTEFVLNEVHGLAREADGSISLKLKDGSQVQARSVVLATGVEFREMSNIPNLKELNGRGVYYGSALTEAPLTKAGEKVYIIGGANSAGQAAMKFSELVGPKGEVVILTRSPLDKSMSQYLIDQIDSAKNIRVETGAVVDGVQGTAKLEGITYKNKDTGALTTEAADSMFVFIGSAPKTHWLSEQLALDEKGFLQSGLGAKKAGSWNLERDPLPNETSIPGVFTAGDVHAGTAKRIITAAGEGANTITQIHQWLGSKDAPRPFYSSTPTAARYAPNVTADIAGIWPTELPAQTLGLMRIGTMWNEHERNRFALPVYFAMAHQAQMVGR